MCVRHLEEAFMRIMEDTTTLWTHENLVGVVIIYWSLRWMECMVGNGKKTISSIILL